MCTIEDLLVIQPSPELQFRGPFTPTRQAVSIELTLTNPTNRLVLFKIKTTMPRRYYVRPNCGQIQPMEKVFVTVTLQLQGLDFDPVFEHGKHKFMVQHCIAPTTYTGESVDDCIRTISANQLHSSRLFCTFVDDDKLTPYNDSPRQSNANEDVISRADSTFTGITNDQVGQGTPQETLAQQKAENERLRAQLAAMMQKNDQLRQSELRLRNIASKSPVAQPTSVQSQDVVVQPHIMTSPVAYAIGLLALFLGLLISRLVF